ncbi:unnamed protein product, partial [Choristocarpus tenellus]
LFRPGISNDLWSLFPMIYNAWDSFAYDLLTNMVVPIDNFISRGTDQFLAGVSPEGRRWD